MKRDDELPQARESTLAIWWWVTGVIAVALLVALCLYVLPPPPESWSKVKRGMTVEELVKAVPNISLLEHPENLLRPPGVTPMPSPYADDSWDDEARSWQMMVVLHADSDTLRVSSVRMEYRCKPWKWLDRPLIEIHRDR